MIVVFHCGHLSVHVETVHCAGGRLLIRATTTTTTTAAVDRVAPVNGIVIIVRKFDLYSVWSEVLGDFALTNCWH